jgi:hypothetical protein
VYSFQQQTLKLKSLRSISNDLQITTSENRIDIGLRPYLRPSEFAAVIKKESGSFKNISVASNQNNWYVEYVSGQPSWVVIAPMGGDGNGSVRVQATQANTAEASRSTMVSFKLRGTGSTADDTVMATMEIVQEGTLGAQTITLMPASMTFQPYGGQSMGAVVIEYGSDYTVDGMTNGTYQNAAFTIEKTNASSYLALCNWYPSGTYTKNTRQIQVTYRHVPNQQKSAVLTLIQQGVTIFRNDEFKPLYIPSLSADANKAIYLRDYIS